MGRHSMPDPEDSVDEPSDESAAGDLYSDDDGGDQGAGQAADAPGSFSDYRRYADARHYAEGHVGGDEDDYADEEFPAGGDRYPDEDDFTAGEDLYPADGAF